MEPLQSPPGDQEWTGVIRGMLEDNELTRVPPSRQFAYQQIEEARNRLADAQRSGNTPGTAYDALYAATRKALIAMLEIHGLRPTASGGDTALYKAVLMLLDPIRRPILRPFALIRLRRDETEYPHPTAGTLPVSAKEISETLPPARSIVDAAEKILDAMGPY